MITDLTSAHFFTGGGGDVTGFTQAGIRPVMALEVAPERCATLRHNHPGVRIYEQDINQLTTSAYPRSKPLIHFYSWPCTNYSVAANVHGHWTGDRLYLEALREAITLWPEVWVVENVMGMRKFPRVMETWCTMVGYHVSEFEVRGEDFELMRKSRLFLIGHRQPFTFAPLAAYRTASPKRQLADYLDPAHLAQEPVPQYVGKRVAGAYRDRPKIYAPEQTVPVHLFGNYKRDRSNYLLADPRTPGGVRPFSVREVSRLHGFPEGYTFAGTKNEQYGQIIDSVMPSVAQAIGHALTGYFNAIPDIARQPYNLSHRKVTARPAQTVLPLPDSLARIA